jgi:hypothetical protein
VGGALGPIAEAGVDLLELLAVEAELAVAVEDAEEGEAGGRGAEGGLVGVEAELEGVAQERGGFAVEGLGALGGVDEDDVVIGVADVAVAGGRGG